MTTNIEEQTPATKADFIKAMRIVESFMPSNQFRVVRSLASGEEAQYFYDTIVALAHTIEAMPITYSQRHLGDEAIAYLHYFRGGCDFHITEKDSEDEQLQAFGLANLGYSPELGYISIVELQENNVELDFHFKPTTLAKIKVALDDDLGGRPR